MTERSAIQTAKAIATGETSARAEAEAAIARIEAKDGAINAVVVRDFDRALAAADEADRAVAAGERRPLLGVPMTVKESYNLAGLPTTWGFEAHRDFIADEDAVAVKRLKAAGAVMLGKTNVPVALADLQSFNPIYGRTNHPTDPAVTCGGSSGGAAAALASGMVPLEIGSDIGGSIRVPSHFCGVWGHKPTYGVLSMDGHYFPGTKGARTVLSVIGPMARDGADLALAFDLLADVPQPRSTVESLRGLRVLVLTQHPLAPVDAEIVAAMEAAAQAVERAGAIVARQSDLLPDLESQQTGYMKMLNVAIMRGLAPPGVDRVTLVEWFDMADHQAAIVRQWAALFEAFDVVFAPVLGTAAFAHSDVAIKDRTIGIGGADTPFAAQFAWPGLATYANLPATAVPVSRTASGLPIGLQVIAGANRDHTAIATARLLDGALS